MPRTPRERLQEKLKYEAHVAEREKLIEQLTAELDKPHSGQLSFEVAQQIINLNIRKEHGSKPWYEADQPFTKEHAQHIATLDGRLREITTQLQDRARLVAEERERTGTEERRVAEESARREAQERERTTAKERATTTINKAFEEFQGVIFRGLADNLSQPSQRKHDIYSAAQTLLDDLKLATKTYLNDPLNPTAQTAFKAICNDLIEQSLKGDIAKEPTLAQACLKCLQEIVNAFVKYTVGLIPGGPQRMFAVAETETVKELKALQTKLNKGDLTAPEAEPESPRSEL
ncbi:hypothetical protein Loa_02762 [Legionella oakridgensis ATCC 33761 = DSM 21215]|uniref:Uncharacterized protein n=1 Tax=Legionella oakridgensis ATCC 33761 = DSM 21215 TaxID=1268635 RepID=W0BI74_9GAMM|nr:hypothetical protein [Legionella oakridgensis]AHE68292.1 hypothetical protein Loa_02762 [Legionella oakridgensis ATCC 33761 = DSM 21215]STY21242.1 Uncharacterised protein [Legionella longbeachae]